MRAPATTLAGLLLSILWSAPSPSQPAPPRPLARADVAQFADSVFARYLARYRDPSLVLAVVHGDSVLLLRGYGHESTSPRRPVDPESTVFNIASLSKLITATAAMQLVERGRLSLDADVRSLLPALAAGVGDDAPLTLRQLLSHTSGLDAPFMREVVRRPGELVSLAEYFRAYPPRRGRPPDREIRYSNYGVALAGHLVEIASGETFVDYAASQVLAPLGMRRSTFLQPPPPQLAARVATAGSGAVPNALLGVPAGSMTSTASDMARFMIAHLNGGRLPDDLGGARVLSEQSVRRMHTRTWSAHPRLPGVALGFFETDLGGLRGLFHTGARTHFSLLYLAPERRIGIFIVQAMRQGGEFRTLRTEFVSAFLSRYLAAAPVALGRTSAHTTGSLRRARRFAGVYRPVLLSSTTIERAAMLGADTRVTAHPGGSLTVSIPGGSRLNVAEQDSGLYRALDGNDASLNVAFLQSSDGRVRGMALAGSTQDPVSFERLRWFERGAVHVGLLGACALLFVVTGMVGLVDAVARVIRRQRGPAVATMSSPERRAWRVAMLTSAFVTLAPATTAAIVMAHTGDDDAADNLRLALTVGLTFLLAAAACGVALVPLAFHAWRCRYWSGPRRVHYAALAAAVVISLPLLGYYHLLGYWL